MEGSIIDILIFAPLAPILGVMLFWFIQLLFIESEKYLLSKIRKKHEPLCRFTNFLGILFQSISHALGYTVTKSGISDFYISIEYGKVAPKKEKKGLFEWVSNAFLFIGPFFIPAFLLLLCLFLLISFDFASASQTLELKYTFGGQITAFGISLYSFTKNFFEFLSTLDLLHPGHLGFLLLIIFLGMGIRPSYIGEKKIEKVDMLYELKNVWNLIRNKPSYLIILFLIAYIIFYLSIFFNQNWYVMLFSIFGWLSITSIISIVITDLILYFIKTTDNIPGFWRVIPFVTLPFSYILIRLLFFFIQNDFTTTISLIIMILSTVIITYILLYTKTNKFKFKLGIKLLKKKIKDETDERG
ncbi:hypothetical protein AYK24_04330 [Thermoplasmatales archaeon SG8-52-4]|nr:MAG: hypothetical protein AYK24_04330 [Thermoplasmatales archaeon SG8-52-4]